MKQTKPKKKKSLIDRIRNEINKKENVFNMCSNGINQIRKKCAKTFTVNDNCFCVLLLLFLRYENSAGNFCRWKQENGNVNNNLQKKLESKEK